MRYTVQKHPYLQELGVWELLLPERILWFVLSVLRNWLPSWFRRLHLIHLDVCEVIFIISEALFNIDKIINIINESNYSVCKTNFSNFQTIYSIYLDLVHCEIVSDPCNIALVVHAVFFSSCSIVLIYSKCEGFHRRKLRWNSRIHVHRVFSWQLLQCIWMVRKHQQLL